MSEHQLDQTTELTELSDNLFRAHTSKAYANMAGPFGGATAATLMRAMVDHRDRQFDPVSFTVNFCAAIKDGAFDISVNLERTGRYLQHWTARLVQGDTLCATATLACGHRGDTFALDAQEMPSVPAAQDCEIQGETGMAPNWLKCYEFRPVEGKLVFANKPHDPLFPSYSSHWVRDHPERPLDYVSLAAMSDAFVLRLLYVRGTLSLMGTISMTTHFHATAEELKEQDTQHLLGTATMKRANQNFHDQYMELWGSNGKLIASGSQLVWFKE